ncbi:MAG: flagellar hook-length control protein FliK [Candidatus Firestonebacteria bacterium]|nr:flagellar hook-length control protein FliK [Candidatus Firestonebacteria bacterium]
MMISNNSIQQLNNKTNINNLFPCEDTVFLNFEEFNEILTLLSGETFSYDTTLESQFTQNIEQIDKKSTETGSIIVDDLTLNVPLITFLNLLSASSNIINLDLNINSENNLIQTKKSDVHPIDYPDKDTEVLVTTQKSLLNFENNIESNNKISTTGISLEKKDSIKSKYENRNHITDNVILNIDLSQISNIITTENDRKQNNKITLINENESDITCSSIIYKETDLNNINDESKITDKNIQTIQSQSSPFYSSKKINIINSNEKHINQSAKNNSGTLSANEITGENIDKDINNDTLIKKQIKEKILSIPLNDFKISKIENSETIKTDNVILNIDLSQISNIITTENDRKQNNKITLINENESDITCSSIIYKETDLNNINDGSKITDKNIQTIQSQSSPFYSSKKINIINSNEKHINQSVKNNSGTLSANEITEKNIDNDFNILNLLNKFNKINIITNTANQNIEKLSISDKDINNDTLIKKQIKEKILSIPLNDFKISKIENAETIKTDSNITNITKPEKQEHILSQITDQIKKITNTNRSEVNFELQPESLGRINLKLVIENKILYAKFIVMNTDVKEIVENNISELKTALEQHSIILDKINVNVEKHSDNSNFSTKQNFPDKNNSYSENSYFKKSLYKEKGDNNKKLKKQKYDFLDLWT